PAQAGDVPQLLRDDGRLEQVLVARRAAVRTFMPPDRSAPAAPAATDPIQLGAVRVLIVDDDELDRRAVRRCLRQAGISEPIDEAASETETLERIGAADYDCILLD